MLAGGGWMISYILEIRPCETGGFDIVDMPALATNRIGWLGALGQVREQEDARRLEGKDAEHKPFHGDLQHGKTFIRSHAIIT